MDEVMTGRDLVLYILQNKLEDKPINDIWCLKSFLTANDAAARYNVGEETIKVWFATGALSGIQIGKSIYIAPIDNESIKKLDPPTPMRAHDAFMRRNCKL